MIAESNYTSGIEFKYKWELSVNPQIEECIEKRSKTYINWVRSLGKINPRENHLSGINFEILQREFEYHLSNIFPKFIIARSHAGRHFDNILIDICSGIHIHHLKKKEALPPTLQNARILAKNYNYAFVEVYEDRILLVS